MKQKTQLRRCVIGYIRSKPNALQYIASLSSRKLNIWVGHCKGDRTHPEHLITIKKEDKSAVLYKRNDSFKNFSGKTLGQRLFPRETTLLCPEGKSFMKLQRAMTKKIAIDHIDIMRCSGSLRGTGHGGGGHHSHFVRIQYGILDVKLNGKEYPIMIVTLQK